MHIHTPTLMCTHLQHTPTHICNTHSDTYLLKFFILHFVNEWQQWVLQQLLEGGTIIGLWLSNERISDAWKGEGEREGGRGGREGGREVGRFMQASIQEFTTGGGTLLMGCL